MIEFGGRGILLDIEGTTSSVSFVYDVMFPFARRELGAYLRDRWDSSELQETREMIARDAGSESYTAWSGEVATEQEKLQLVEDEVVRLMDGDVKATGLKQLQGLIWRSGFESGEMRAHVYDDVPGALEAWSAAGRDIRIYSSGSVAAQKLFFGHTICDNLLHFFQGHYDTTTGGKKEPASYELIAAEFGLAPREILFLSDVTAELDAAAATGMRTGLCLREGNVAAPAGHGHSQIEHFGQVTLVS